MDIGFNSFCLGFEVSMRLTAAFHLKVISSCIADKLAYSSLEKQRDACRI